MTDGDWIAVFPDLSGLEPETRANLMRVASPVSLPKDSVVFRPGDACGAYLLVLEGSVRVQMIAESGREIVLYRVETGQTCILTTACLLGQSDYAAEAITEEPVRAVAIPAGAFQQALDRSPVLRTFVFTHYGTRIMGLMALIEEVAFGRIDLRLARFLLNHGGAEAALTRTHQEIAVELGTAREVVSRQLKEFERRGWVSLGRGRVSITDKPALKELLSL
ncbi:MAG: Crp/Fnr family transcriptional regulator [Magnetospiraceae bacterium]